MASGKLPPDTKSIVVCHVIDKRSVIVVAVFKGGEYAHIPKDTTQDFTLFLVFLAHAVFEFITGIRVLAT